MQLINITRKLRILGIIGLISMVLSQPEWVGIIVGIIASLTNIVAVYLALYLLDKRYTEVNLFKTSVYQLVVMTVVLLVMSLISTQSNTQNAIGQLYMILALMLVMLLLLAYVNYKMAKKIANLAKVTNNIYFKYSGMVLLISAYTMPFIVGLIFFVVSLVLFLLGCSTYKDVITQEQQIYI